MGSGSAAPGERLRETSLLETVSHTGETVIFPEAKYEALYPLTPSPQGPPLRVWGDGGSFSGLSSLQAGHSGDYRKFFHVRALISSWY